MSEPNDQPTPEEMLACLNRSGYCFEGRLVKTLSALDMFVETSQAMIDPITGKNREIDMVAEPGIGHGTPNAKVCVKTTFVIEAVNNLYPAVLLTEKVWSPNTIDEDYLPHLFTPPEAVCPHPFLAEKHGDIFGLPNLHLHTQYCAFSRKKSGGELMASHPEDLYGSIHKAVDYAFYLRNSASWMNDSNDDYWRIFNWQPVVALQNELLVLTEDEQGRSWLKSVDRGFLELNLHIKGEPKSVIVAFVTEKGFTKLILDTLARDYTVETKMAEHRTRGL